MAAPDFKIHENTAAALLHYQSYTKNLPGGKTELAWTRWSSANENFNITSTGGRRFLINFDKNFSKKHLATFSKKQWVTELSAYLNSLAPGQDGKDEENWHKAQIDLMNYKILKTLGIRSGLSDLVKCKRCSHPKKNNPPGTGHSNAGNCQVPGCAGVTCIGGYLSSYTEGRTEKGKHEADPYAGQPASTSSCIVLNWIPKNEFELAIANAILAVDPNNVLPNSPTVGHNPPLEHLRLNFTGRPGAVRCASGGVVTMDNGTWCQVGARKTLGGPPGIDATWTIVHWEGQG